MFLMSDPLLAQQSSESERVWTWSQACPSVKQLRIEALLHEKVIFTKDVTICLMDR